MLEMDDFIYNSMNKIMTLSAELLIKLLSIKLTIKYKTKNSS